MTELEKRLKHIEKTNAKRTKNYRKLQQQADENFYKIQQREQKQEQNKIQMNQMVNGNRNRFITKQILSNPERTSNNLLKAYTNDLNAKKNKANDEALDYLLKFNQKYHGKSKDDNARIAHEIGDINYFKALKTGDDYRSWTEDTTNKTIDDYYNEYKAISDPKSPKSSMIQVNEQIKNSNGLKDAFSEKRNSSELRLRVTNVLDRINQVALSSILPYPGIREAIFNYWQKKIDAGKEEIAENRKIEADTVNSRLQTGYEKMYEEIPYNQDTLNAIEKGISETKDEDIIRLTEDEEKLRYYYLRGTYGKSVADDYILSAVNDATIEEGKKRAENDSTLGEFGNAFNTGLADWSRGIYKAADSLTNQAVGDGFLDDYAYINPTDKVQQQYNKEAAGKVKKFALDATETIGNQAPSIIIASATGSPTLGVSTLAVSAMGNSYGQALLEGKSEDEAFTYGAIQGASEFVTEKLLGGQFGINGITEKTAHKALNNVTNKLIKDKTMNAVANKVGKIVINGVGEFNEEALQQFMEPYFRNFSFGENNKQTQENLEDCLYSGLLGFFSSGITNTAGEVATGTVNAVANKISDKKLSKAKNIYNAYQEQLLAEKQNENQTDNIEPPTVEAVFSKTETSQEKAKRLTKTINKIDRGEKVADSEIVELKYNKTAADMLGQMAGLKEGKITSDFDNETVRAVINQAQNGKKNIDTATILNNIRSDMQSNQNLVENSNENGSDETLNADEGNLTNTNQMALQNATEPNMTSQIDEVSEAMPENLTADDETEAPNNNTYSDNVSDNLKNTFNRVVNNSNKIIKLGISSEKTGSTNIRKVESVENGVAQLLMTNGEVVSADTIDFSDNKNAEIILSNAGKYNSSTANTFILNYDSSKNTAENYSVAFNSVYRMAEKGLSMDTIVSQTRGARAILGEKTFNAAINAGRNTANGTFADDTTNVTSGVRKTDVSNQRTSQNKKVNINAKGETSRINVRQSAKSLSTALGVKINVYNSDTSVRGYEQNGEVFINESYVNSKANSASEFNFILAHELTHTLEQSNYYDQLKTFILNSRVYDDYLTSNDTTHKAEISKRQELYEKNGKELTKEEAERELIADFIADELLTNEECIRELAYKDKKLFAKVVDFIHKMIDNLKRFVRNSKEITVAQKDLIHIKELYTKAFNDVRKNGTYSNEVKYSKKLGGYNPDIRVTTDNVLKEYGIKNIRNVTDVINKVCLKLSKSYLSSDNVHKPVTNIDTGLKIEIRKSGIKETFGKPTYYKSLSNDLKLAKIASMNELAKMIKYGEVRAKDASNYHNPKSRVRFSYLKSSINIDGINYDVTMDIKRLPNNDNIFYIHDLKIKKQETNSVHRTANGLKVNLPLAKDNISQNDDIVNSNIRKNAENDTRKFSINPEFEAQYDNWDKKNQHKVFILGKTSNALKSVGLSDKTITMDSSKILKIKKKHSAMTDDIIKNVPKVLENPVAIMKSKTQNNRITMFGSLTDTDGKPVLAVLELNPMKYGYKLDEYKVASAYGKDNLQNLINTSEILYVDNKKRTTDLLNETRLQLPSTFNKGSSSDIIISNDDIDVNNNIRKKSENDTNFELKEAVEERKDLVAIHNLSEEKLLKALQLGGMPMPSIAVTKGELGHTDYGEISLVFGKDTIDPQKNVENKVYGGDVWSPTYPNIEYKLNEKALQNIQDRAINLPKTPFFNSVNYHQNNINDRLKNKGNYEKFIDSESNDYGLKQLYLYETTGEAVEMIKKTSSKELDNGTIKMYDYLIKKMGDSFNENINHTDWLNRYSKIFEDSVKNYYKNSTPYITDEELNNIYNKRYPNRFAIWNDVRGVRNYIEKGAKISTVKEDIAGTKKAIDEKINEKEYKKWVKDFYSGIIERSGIRNNIEAFTQTGNRRSFEKLHYEETLENVVKAMKEQENGTSIFSGNGIWSLAAKNYGTINDIKADSNRLSKLSEDDVKKRKEAFGKRFSEIANALISNKNYDNNLIALDKAFGNIIESVKNKKTKSGILSDLRQYYGNNATESLVDDILNLIADIGNMPVDYFEAKPQRTVYFNEVKKAVVPQETSAELINGLKKAGVGEVITYTDKADRLKKLNSFNDVKFSLDPDVESQMKTLNEQYGTKKKGENPVRDIDVPERSSKDKRVREFVKTILESGALTDEMVNEVDKQIVKGAASYLPLSNEKALTIAKEWLDNKGKGVTEKQWNDWEIMKNRNHKVSALDVAKGELLLRYAAQNNETKKVIQLTGELAEMATTAGQTVQAMRLLKKSSGIGKLYYIEQTVRRMNADYQAKYANKLAKGKDIPQIKIDEDLALKLAQAKTQTEIEEAEIELNKDIGKQVPATWIDKWNAWRYMSMLFNPTTHIRNVVGNTIFMPAVSMKNGIAYGLEKAFLKGDIEKSKALKVKAAYKEFAKQDFDYVKAELTGTGKYESTDAIKANKVIFNNKKFEGLRNLNTNLLEAEDGIFLKHHYEHALGMYLQSNNISLNELSDEKAESERQAVIDRGRVRAITEAQKATYRDASKMADTLSRIAKTNLATEIMVEGVIPFKKTPVNIAKRAVEYSPVGLIKSLTKDLYELRQGKISSSEYIDRISAGLTGAALYSLGMFLGSLGLLKVGLGDDDKEKEFEELKGHQEYSIELFGYSYTFDWACPAAIPIFVGAKTQELLEMDNSGITAADCQDLSSTMLDPMFEMSVLSGIDNLINNVKYSESPVVDSGLYAATSYVGQAVPTLGGKIASTIDGTRRSSYIDKSKETFISKSLTNSQQQFVNKIIKKIPGATYLLSPYLNEWGEKEKEMNVGVRIFDNFISPGYTSKIEVDEVEKMLDDTYKSSGNSAVLPTKSKKYFSIGGETVNLTADEYEAYATVRGQMAHSILKDLSNNSDFKSADSSDKANLISQSYDLSNAIAKQGVSNYEPDGWIAKAINANEKGMKYSDFLVLHSKLKEINGEGTKERIYNKIKNMNINKKAKEAMWLSFYDDMTLEGKRIYFN